jgi:protein phosphatase
VPIRLDAAAVSDVGPHRSVNQDAAFAASWGAAVADGVGGGPSGDLASAALVHRLVAGRVRAPDEEQLVERLRLANWDLRAHTERSPALRGMATTFTGLFVGADDRLTVVGDRWLLCSDGLSDYVAEDLIGDILSRHREPAAAAGALVEVAIDAGTYDNVTAVVCDVCDGGVDDGDPVFSGAAAARFTEGLERD